MGQERLVQFDDSSSYPICEFNSKIRYFVLANMFDESGQDALTEDVLEASTERFCRRRRRFIAQQSQHLIQLSCNHTRRYSLVVISDSAQCGLNARVSLVLQRLAGI